MTPVTIPKRTFARRPIDRRVIGPVSHFGRALQAGRATRDGDIRTGVRIGFRSRVLVLVRVVVVDAARSSSNRRLVARVARSIPRSRAPLSKTTDQPTPLKKLSGGAVDRAWPREPGHFPRTYIRVTSCLLASGICDGHRLASCPGSDPVPARTSTLSAPSAERRSRTGTAGSSPVQRVSTSAKSVSICAPRSWKRSAGPRRDGAWARDAGHTSGTYISLVLGPIGGRLIYAAWPSRTTHTRSPAARSRSRATAMGSIHPRRIGS